MVEVKSFSEFYRHNDGDVDRIMRYILSSKGTKRMHYKVENSFKDIKQKLYISILNNKTIESFDPALGNFSTYMYTCIHNFLSANGRQGGKAGKAFEANCSAVIRTKEKIADIQDYIHSAGHVNGKASVVSFSADPSVGWDSMTYGDREYKVLNDLEKFRSYIKSLKKPESVKERMDLIITQSWEGLNNVEIGDSLNISSMAVGNIKRTLADYFQKYKRVNA